MYLIEILKIICSAVELKNILKFSSWIFLKFYFSPLLTDEIKALLGEGTFGKVLDCLDR